jgi:hypothetical protein
MEQDLPATSGQFSLSLSLFVLMQGFMPIAWTALGEIKGRKVRLLNERLNHDPCNSHAASDRLSASFSTLYGRCYRYCSESLNRTVSSCSFTVTISLNVLAKV